MLRKDCMTVKEPPYRMQRFLRAHSANLTEKSSILLRFVSKNEMDFNEISTGFSTAKVAFCRQKCGRNRDRNRAKSQVWVSCSRPIMSCKYHNQAYTDRPYRTSIESEISLVRPYR